MRYCRLMFISALLSLAIIGCSSLDPLVEEPVSTFEGKAGFMSAPGTQLWGLYDIAINAEMGVAEITPLRAGEFEMNAIGFLEPPGAPLLTISNLEFALPEVGCTVNIRHPYPGLTKFSAFMVRGVVLTDGSMGGFDNPALVMSDHDELRLKNADGYTRWMNPLEFPYDGTMQSYKPGSMGDPDGYLYASTLNPYKLFADSLNAVDDNLDLNEENKSVFTAGAANSRRYDLDFGSQPMRFQYAVVASWEPPLEIPPQIPDDFPLGTVASEPWRLEADEIINHLYYMDGEQGGQLVIQILVRDFEDSVQDTVFIEAPGIFPRQEMELKVQDGTHLTFELTVADIELYTADPFELLVAAVATDGEGYNGHLPGEECATYMLHEIEVFLEPQTPPGWPFYDDFESYPPYEWTAHGGDWWGKDSGYMDAAGGGDCYEEDTGSDLLNPNLSYVSSPGIPIPESDKDVVIVINHTIDVDPAEWLGHWWWDACFVMIDGEKIFPTDGPPYEEAHDPYSFDDYWCWTGSYDWTESTFNIGPDYNGTTIHVEFALDTWDYIKNCDPPYFGWLLDDVYVNFAE